MRNGCPALYFLTEGNVRCSLYIFKELLWKNFRCGRCTHGSVPKRNNFWTGRIPAKEGISLNELRDQVCAEKEYMINLRRDFHRHPELSLQERRTAGVIEQELERFEISHTRIGATGVLGILRGAQSGSGVVALRADIDALPFRKPTMWSTVLRQTESCTPVGTMPTQQASWVPRKSSPKIVTALVESSVFCSSRRRRPAKALRIL